MEYRLSAKSDESRSALYGGAVYAAQDTLPGDERQRLLRLAAAAEEEIQRLAGWPAIEAA